MGTGTMTYGFKLLGMAIPDGTIAINAIISDGTTTNEYVLTGSVADGFSGTGAAATAPGELKLDETEVITDTPIAIDDTVSQWLNDKVTNDTISSVQARVGTHILTYDSNEGGFISTDGPILYELFYTDPEASWLFVVADLSADEETLIPGTYQLSIYDGSATFNLTIDAFTLGDMGDSYSISVSSSQPAPAFIDAIKKALNIPTKDGAYELEISNGTISWYEGK